MQIKSLAPDLAVSAQISPSDLKVIADQGFKTILNNRPDYEEPNQPAALDIAAQASMLGMKFLHQPVISGGVTLEDVQEFSNIMDKVEKPVLAYCRSGTRCATLWALSQAGKQDTDTIIKTTTEAGFDFSAMRSTIDRLADQQN